MTGPVEYRGWHIKPYQVRGMVSYKAVPLGGGSLGAVEATGISSLSKARQGVRRFIE